MVKTFQSLQATSKSKGTTHVYTSFFNPFAPGDFAEKRVLKPVERFSGHCLAIKS